MSLLSTIAVLALDPHARALERLKEARADLAVAEQRAADGTTQREARILDVKAWPHCQKDTLQDWNPSRDAGTIDVLEKKDAVYAAEVEYDNHEPRIEALRDRVRQTCEQLANARNNPRIAAIGEHVDALRNLGVDVPDLATAAAQRDLGDELGRIAEDLRALGVARRAEGMPQAHLLCVQRVGECPALRNIGVYEGQSMLDGLRQAAYATALTVELLDAIRDVVGTKPAPPPWRSTPAGFEIKDRRKQWEQRQTDLANREESRRLGLRY
jgi:hypothetical protein